jgi:Zn-dependent M28 family amino/carboxypeptidase
MKEVTVRRLTIVVSALVVALLIPVQSASAVDEVNTKRFRNAVTVGGIMSHERALQRIANRNGGTRASGTPGYEASVEYVEGRLQAAGYETTRQEFTFPFFRELTPAQLQQVSPTPTDYETGTFEYSGSGDVTGTVVPIDIDIPPPAEAGTSDSGCEPADFPPASPTEPQVALIQRGFCNFEVKAVNAEAAGYDAVIIFNEGQEGRQELFIGTLGNPQAIPVVGLSFADASALYAAAQAGPVTVRAFTETEVDLEAKTWNVTADTPSGDADKVLVVGAHLDSVVEGPGINDNGSGSSLLLEMAEELSDNNIRVRQKVRFAFWGAEESGLLGSEHYVENLSDDELGSIFANLNFDMVGSPNYVRFVYDGDGSDTELAGPPGSGEIESIFTDYFASQGLASAPTEFSGRSDYGPFIAVGIPAGGLFTGAEGVKTEEEAEIYGGTAGVAYDPNYHQAGDDINNLSTKALFEMGDAGAHALLTLAKSRTGFFEDGSRMARKSVAAESFDYRGSHAVR